MKNYAFITMIQNIGDANHTPDIVNSREVFLTLINGFMYVKPGENTTKFYKDFRRCLSDGRAAGEVMYFSRGKHTPFSKCIRTTVATALLDCIKNNFDEVYFDTILDKIDEADISNRNKVLAHGLGLKQRQELSELLTHYKSLDKSSHIRGGVTANDNFARLMAKIICYTDTHTAYTYANMLVDLDRVLNMDAFNSRNFEVTIDFDRVAS